MKEFNLNNYVYFKPTDVGLKIYNDHYKIHNFDCSLELNADGFAELQFHCFVEIYGKSICSAFIDSKLPFHDYSICFDEGDFTQNKEEICFRGAGFKITTIETDGELKGFNQADLSYKERIENSIKRQERYIENHEVLLQINLSENNFSIASRRMKSILVAQEKIKLLRGILND